MTNSLSLKFEKAIHFITKHFPVSVETSRKPRIFHVIRVGVYLYNHNYSEDIVLGGLLHDSIEWSRATKEIVKDEFGDKVLKLVLANTKDDSISDKYEKTVELIQRCVRNGQDALIIKTADILDSFKWYSDQNNQSELKYCVRNANAILKFKPDNFNDKIFDELKIWQQRFSNLSE